MPNTAEKVIRSATLSIAVLWRVVTESEERIS